MTRALTSPRFRIGLLGASVAALLVLGPPEIRQAIAYLSPFLALIACLLADRYPGERLIARRARRAVPPTRRNGERPVVSFAALLPRGAHLLAFALAGRGPPPLTPRPGPLQISF
jgi:hypothetical protein